MLNRCILFLMGILLCTFVSAQADTAASDAVDGKFIGQLSQKADVLDAKLKRSSQNVLRSFLKEEEKLRRKLARKDSTAAAKMFGDTRQQYEKVQSSLSRGGKLQQYIPSLDTLQSSLRFLEQHPQLMAATKDAPQKLKAALAKMTGLESEFQKAEEVTAFIKQRKQYLTDQLSGAGMTKELAGLNKQGYYYCAQVKEYKELLKDHRKAERKALQLLSQTQVFKDFMRKNSLLSSLFRMPDDPSANTPASLAGLQTRTQVNSLVQQQISAGGPNAQAQFTQNMQQAQEQLNALKTKLNKLGGGDGDWDMPEGFKPNNQKTKTFWRRIEWGTNIQSQRSNGYFPVTSDLALTAGYKLNDNSIIGVGAGYKLGWGKNIRQLKFTHEGMSLRSFIDIRLKKSFWITGGYEMNYRSAFSRIAELRDLSAWQESGLIGLSKVIDQRSKLLKKAKVQLLWDFLSYRQVPESGAVKFRIGYSF